MNITFLIGNGFDLGLPLKTTYADFYQVYNKLNHDDLISVALRKQSYDYWSDLEVGLGKITSEIKTDKDLNAYLDSKNIIETELAKYLQDTESHFRIVNNQDFSKEFQGKIQALPSELDATNRLFLRDEVFAQSSSSIVYQFITFNYTNCLDAMLDCLTHDTSERRVHHRFRGSEVLDSFSSTPFHIHGTIDSDFLMGVGDVSQIDNETYRKNPSLNRYLIKKNINEEMGNRRIADAKNIITDSQVVVLYGLSLGITDIYWWCYLRDWLKEKSVRRLVIFNYDKRGVTPSASESLRRKRAVIEHFLTLVGEANVSSNPLGDRIVVVNSKGYFLFKAIAID